MSDRNDGGYAFPHPGTKTDGGGDFVVYPELGMSLRDYFAGQAISGAIQRLQPESIDTEEEAARHVARMSYKVADAMIAARAKGGAS